MTAAACVYQIRVDGHLGEHWAGWFGGTEAVRHDDGTTTLVTAPADQAAVHGVLAGLRDIGVRLLSVHTLVVPADVPADLLPAVRSELTTERLTLRAATVEDAQDTWRYRRLPEVAEWLTGTPVALDDYRDEFADPQRLAVTVAVLLGRGPSAPVIGDFMLKRRDAWAQAEVRERAQGQEVELGWVLDPRHAGHGYATEAARALLAHSFTELRVRRVTANCFLGNERSWRLMERLGMRREAHAVRDALHRSGHWLDSVSYALLAEEWSAR